VIGWLALEAPAEVAVQDLADVARELMEERRSSPYWWRSRAIWSGCSTWKRSASGSPGISWIIKNVAITTAKTTKTNPTMRRKNELGEWGWSLKPFTVLGVCG